MVWAPNLGGETVANRQAGRVVLGAVDAQAGRQALDRGVEMGLRGAQVALGVERGDVAPRQAPRPPPCGGSYKNQRGLSTQIFIPEALAEFLNHGLNFLHPPTIPHTTAVHVAQAGRPKLTAPESRINRPTQGETSWQQ